VTGAAAAGLTKLTTQLSTEIREIFTLQGAHATQRCWPRSSGRSGSTDGGPPTSAPSSLQPAGRRHHDRPVRHSG